MDTLNTWGDQQHAYDPTNQCQLLVELARLPSSIPHAKHAAASTPRRPGAKLRFSTVELTVSGDMVTVDGRAEYKPCKASAHPVPPSKPLPQRILSLYAANNEGAYLMRLEEKDDAQATMLVMPMSKRDGRVLEMLSESRRGSVGEVEKTKTAAVDDFTQRTDEASSNLYFYYYGMLQHQANMLQDHIRTGTYFAALTENAADFQGKAVMDVGCGSGILSFFAAQAGARVVYAVEASDFARHAARLVETNPALGARIKVIKGKVEEMELPEKVDVLVSEPMGTLLVNERMLETYIHARKHHLKPGGLMFPSSGTIFCTAFSDEMLWNEISNKSAFWMHNSFYGVDLGALAGAARKSAFGQPVIDQIPPQVLVSNSVVRMFDFQTLDEQELVEFEIPLSLEVSRPCVVHGIAAWFDVAFAGSTCQRTLSTSPGVPCTHWYQLRCMLAEPVRVRSAGETITGVMRFKAHSRQSYDVSLEVMLSNGERSCGSYDLKEPYYRQLVHTHEPAMYGGGEGACSADYGWSEGGSGGGSGRGEDYKPSSPGEETWWV